MQKRPLTDNEIQAARSIFKGSIDYSKVRIHNRGFFRFFGLDLQTRRTAVTPNGSLYFRKEDYRADFALGYPDGDFDVSSLLWFMHEMTHVWQYQLGYPVMLRGAVRIGLDYAYNLREDASLASYNMEAQGNILSDYFYFRILGGLQISRKDKNYVASDLPLYEKVLRSFLDDPSDKANLPSDAVVR
ncbi:Rhs element Vgr protein [Haematospirillum jordaniae]|uniref:Rhs element Vgr protein n=1 Tax=Haematospirillum jordaniae TaxID=1549855 RepID=UPI001432EC33|nr:Rhs element Vgr protein [Haematospirillum jordaniae]NKD86627.1 Rhs element Vgr protein [Haematospirillum jordaniae]